jgi:DNA-binding NarL/FixJ family response regulator
LIEEADRFGTTVDRILAKRRGNQEEISARRTVMRRLRADGSTTGQIARWLHRDISTVRFHIDPRYRKLKIAQMDARYAERRA